MKEVQFLFDLYDERKLARIKPCFPISECDILLDAGCGPGYRTMEARLLCLTVVAVDLSRFCLEELVRKLHAVPYCRHQTHVVLADIQHLPFRNGSFTKAICTDVLEHVNHDRIAVKEINRTLITNGLLYMSVPHRDTEELYRRLDRSWFWKTGHVRTYDPDAILRLLRSEGFQVLGTERSGFLRALYHVIQILLRVTIEKGTGKPLLSEGRGSLLLAVWRVAKPLYRSRIGMTVEKSGATILATALQIYTKKTG